MGVFQLYCFIPQLYSSHVECPAIVDNTTNHFVSHTGNNSMYMDKSTLACDIGYRLLDTDNSVNHVNIECTSIGTWNQITITCEKKGKCLQFTTIKYSLLLLLIFQKALP